MQILPKLGHQQIPRSGHTGRCSFAGSHCRSSGKTRPKSVAYTYNDPTIFHEYAIDVAAECRKRDIKSVAVTAGYVCEAPRREFFAAMDAANVDLKSFSEEFYYKLTGAHFLQPVLDTLLYLKHQNIGMVGNNDIIDSGTQRL